MVYVSDHGESLGEHGLYLHGSPYLLAPEDQTHIPAMMWFSPLYQRSLGLNTQCVRQKTAKSYSHDNLFHSVLGLLDVKTKTYQSKLDLFAGCRMDASQAADATAAQTPHPQNGVF
jgi:lipid A ethanolaminephosphotransferase